MRRLTRRDTLKTGGTVLVGSALVGCSSDLEAPGQDSKQTETGDTVSGLYDKGTADIATSGWTKTQGLGAQYASLDKDLMAEVLVIGQCYGTADGKGASAGHGQ